MTGIRLRAPIIHSTAPITTLIIIVINGAIKLFISVPMSLFSGQTAKNPAKFEAFCNQSTPSRQGGATQRIPARDTGQEPKHRAGGVALPNKQQPPPNIPPRVQASKHSAPPPSDRHDADNVQIEHPPKAGNTHIEHPEQAHVEGINGREHITQTGAHKIPK